MISYANMKLKPVTTTHKFEWNGNEIEVLDYLPIEDKYDLIMITLQKSFEDGYYNPIKVDEFFHLHLIYMYTNINFTDKQREDEHKLYDSLKSNGLIDAFIEQMNEFDYSELFNMLDDTKRELTEYHRTIVSLVKGLITDLPKQAEAMSQILDNFDEEKFKNVIDFAKAANGGREITE